MPSVFDRIGVIRGRFPPFWTESSHGVSALMEDQAVEVVGEVGECQFGFGAGQPDGADEQAEAVFLMGEDVLDPGADGGFLEVGGAGAFRHWFAVRLAAVNAADEVVLRQPFLVAL